MSAAVQAQQAASDAVVVTGIRASIESAISEKKNATSIVETISAEDIGKLPDNTIAESIARLPGVTAQRNSATGKASSISIRGLAPDFNGALLNGREQASTGDSRGVEFDLYPAELLTGVTVYKTPDAEIMGQGLAGTINLRTVRPLDIKQRSIAASARHMKLGEGTEYDPGKGNKLTFSYVDQFADRTLGVALGVSKLKEAGSQIANFNNWGGWIPDNTVFNGQNVLAPGGFTSRTESTAADRTAIMGTLQFKPNRSFETSFDYFHSDGNFRQNKTGLEGPVGGLSSGGNDSGGTLLPGAVIKTLPNGKPYVESGTWTNFRGVVNNHPQVNSDKLDSLGWNTKLKLNNWQLNGDLATSRVTRTLSRFETTLGIPAGVTNAGDTITMTGFNGTDPSTARYSTGLNYADPNIIKLTDPQGWGGGPSRAGFLSDQRLKDKVDTMRLSGRTPVNMGFISDLDLGVNHTTRVKAKNTVEGALLLASGAGSANVPNPGSTTAGTTGIPIITWDPSGSLGNLLVQGKGNDGDILAFPGKNWSVKENVTTSYVKGNIDTEWAKGRALRGNMGLQLVKTKQSSDGYYVDASNCNATLCTFKPATAGTSYTDVLPSLNLVGEMGNDDLLRLGLAKTVARPNMGDMRASFDFNYDATKGLIVGAGGNPQLKPFRADGVDLSYEKYFGKKAYVSAGAFYKQLNTYILRVSQPFNYQPVLAANTNIPGATPRNGLFTTPINGNGGNINGIELAANLPFEMLAKPLEGFGMVINHSDTKSSVSMPASGFSTTGINAATNISLPGLSRRVTNMRFYYEKSGFQASVARRSRSDFIGEITDYQDSRQLTYVKGESIIDAQLGYEFKEGALKGLSVLFQGVNLSNAKFREFTKAADGTPTISSTKTYGKTYIFGLNYKL